MTFEKLQVDERIVKALQEQEITQPTEIQEKSIPLIIEGKDVIGMSKTGSGKTLSFGIPIIEKMDPNGGLQALIMAPTRELALQISQELEKISKYKKLDIAIVFGGVALGPQVKQIARSQIVVGTPGRLLDHLGRETLNLSKIKMFVLDEADKMVEMGFIEDVNRILSYTPRERQIILFGATISSEIADIRERHMQNPVVAKAESHVEDEYLEQYYYDTAHNQKFSLLVHLLKTEDIKRVIIFCSTRSTVELVTKNLRANKVNAEMIHGKLSQNRRLRIIESFNKGKQDIMVASAVAARGLHIHNVSHVINYDLSRDPQEYIHRVGRTARAGSYGKAITLLSNKDHEIFSAILSRYPVKIEKLKMPDFPRLRFQARQRDDRRNPRQSFSRPRRRREEHHVVSFGGRGVGSRR